MENPLNEGLVDITFARSNKPYTFKTSDPSLSVGDFVVVESEQGLSLARVVREFGPCPSERNLNDFKSLVRRATSEDLQMDKKNKLLAMDVQFAVSQLIQKEGLNMQLVDVFFTLDQNKVYIRYSAENRVDFRSLLKQLVARFPYRIELVHIGQRDKAKLVGGLGVCGRELCCKGHLSEFSSISIHLAKNQMLSLNASKLAGQCEKLKCCLRYENEMYKSTLKDYPPLHSKVKINDTIYFVNEINIVNETLVLSNRSDRLVVSLSEFQERGTRDVAA